MSNSLDNGILRAAMAYRVKYRKEILCEGKLQHFTRLMPRQLCPHNKNRGGVYPNENAVRDLGVGLLDQYFLQEEADHLGVCVEEVPSAERPPQYVTYEEYNLTKSEATTYLKGIFQGHQFSYGTLAHNHLVCVLLAWITGAKWDLKNEDNSPRCCDDQGHLLQSAVAELPNAKEMITTIKEGLKMEVLSYKINLEEPKGCSVIAQAMNKGHAMALRTAELTALNCLTGEITLQFETKKAEEISFEGVKEKVAQECDHLVHEPEFIEMFDFVISLGAEKLPYLPGFMKFGEMFVNQKLRALRLSAFAVVNKIDKRCPRIKVALLKRAYKKTPSYGFCPSPEAAWASKLFEELEPLENVLHYFHVEAKAAVAAILDDTQQHTFLANVDCAATEAYFLASTTKKRSAVLEACHKYYVVLEEGVKKLSTKLIPPSKTWMVFTPPVQSKAASPQKLAPKLLEFDVDTGKLLNSQEEKEKDVKTKKQFQLPWRLWCNADATLHMGDEKIDEDAIQMALHLLHKENHIVSEPIDVQFDESRNSKRVLVTEDLRRNEQLQIFPCVPKAAKVYRVSEHPHRVPITVVRREKQANVVTPPQSLGGTDAAVAEEAPTEEVKKIYYVHPEWKSPKESLPTAEGVWTSEWDWTGDETMHPFWAVRRLTTTQMSKEPPDDKSVAGFSIKKEKKEYTVVTVGTVQTHSVAMTIIVQIPVFTNSKILTKGTELIMEQAEVQKQVTKRGDTWKEESNAKRRKEEQGRKKEQDQRVAKQKSKGARTASVVTEI